MQKNIVILFDGTSNEIRSDRTNVLRLYGTLEKSQRQLVGYWTGVGTFGAANSWSYYARKAWEVFGLATGWGLDQNVKEAYRFLVAQYDNGKRSGRRVQPRDAIWIIGFSRGAYTARVLAGFLNAFGLIRAENLNLLDAAYSAYKGIVENPDAAPDWDEMNLYDRVLRPDHPPVRCLGLFDTVASVTEFGRYGPRLRAHACTSDNPSVQAVRHAVSIEERRRMFQPMLWPAGQAYHGNRFRKTRGMPQDCRELWFAGVHGDVGGGYPEKDSALAKVPLDWMIRETAAMGLHYRTQTVNMLVLGANPKKHYVGPNPRSPAQDSMTGLWRALEYLPKRRAEAGLLGWYVPMGERRPIAPGAIIHDSVQGRSPAPPNLPPGPTYQP